MSIAVHIQQAVDIYLKRRFPYTSPYSYTVEEQKSIKKKYAKWKLITKVMMLTLIIGLSMLYAFFFYHAYALLVHLVIGPPYVASFRIDAFLLPGFALCLCTMGYPMAWVQRYFMGADGYVVFGDYLSTWKQYDLEKAEKWMNKLFRIPFAPCLLLACSTGIIASPKGLTFRGLIDMGHKYNYEQVKNVTYYRYYRDSQGQLQVSHNYKITFSDNYFIYGYQYFDSGEMAQPLIRLLNKPVDTIKINEAL